MTGKLYYEDAYIKECTAQVRGCERAGEYYLVCLDRTCFYPEGGGQSGDTGRLNDAIVYDTQEKDGEVFHYTKEPLEVGAQVLAVIDWERRFDFMQQHSGEHMISGLIHSKKGYENVGFHMGAEVTTIDLSGSLTWEELMDVEAQVNARIWRNDGVKTWYPPAEELPSIPYRSKKELTGDVRIVEFPETDICACCGMHVKATGEIGLVKILSMEKFHEGVRLEILCGERAANYLRNAAEQNRQVSRLLSAKPLETAAAVERQSGEMNALRQRLYELEEAYIASLARESSGKGNVLLFPAGLEGNALQRTCDAVQKTCGGCAAVFSGTDEDGYKYAIGQVGGDLRSFVKEMNAVLSGRGGGRPYFVQGSVKAARAQIEAFFQENGF